MPFFQPVYSPADQAFGNLLRLIDGFDTVAVPSCNPPAAKQAKTNNSKAVRHQQQPQQQPQQQQQQQQQQRQQTPPALAALQALLPSTTSAVLGRPFNPRFDVRETESAYELHGELAGVDRKDVVLEFTEPQTLVVSGRIERNYSSQTPPAEEAVPDAVSDAGDEPTVPSDEGARTPASADEDEPFTEVTHEAHSRSSSPASRHPATVADADEDGDVTMTPAVPATSSTPTTTTTTTAKKPATKTTTVAKQAAPASAAPTERYWVQERAVGEFQRTFNFPVPVDEANVRAALDNGILSVTVPKAVKPQTRRIAVL